jgi:WD40 repeat protein/serine/threonine protein kinase/tetratricopeptide (TPR) repeat protein
MMGREHGEIAGLREVVPGLDGAVGRTNVRIDAWRARANEPVSNPTDQGLIMSDESTSARAELPLDVLDAVDRICDRFEAAWRSGARPRIADYLGEVAEAYRPALARDLLAAERDARRRLGERPDGAEYAASDPELADWIGALLAAPAPRPPGRSLAGADDTPSRLGDYRILREIGRGGMGVVYEAVQQSLGRHVALKVLRHASPSDWSHLERFRLEARAAARLHHTNIVPVFGVGECDGLHYYAMQYIPGQGLDVVIDALRGLRDGPGAFDADNPGHAMASGGDDRTLTTFLTRAILTDGFAAPGPEPKSGTIAAGMAGGASASGDGLGSELPPGRSDAQSYRSIARIGLHVAGALAYAHAQGILHRDIKPSNLLLDAQGTVWVTDFGLAKAEGSDGLTHTGDVVGTLRYMAPERFDGRSDPRSDVYSLGATLYELLTLRPPFREPNRVKLIEQVLRQDPTPPRQLDRRIPRDLETIVLKAMAREPSRRYATAGALAEDLDRFLAGRPIRARRVSPWEQAWRWSRRNPGLAALSAALLLALAGGTIAASLLAARATSQARKAGLEADRANRLAADLKAALDRSNRLSDEREASLKESHRHLAALHFERGQADCERGEVGPGLLRLVEAWRSAVAADDQAWQHAARAGLAAWLGHHARLEGVFTHSRPVHGVAFSPDGKTILTGCEDNVARLWDAAGRPIGEPLRHQGRVLSVAFSPDGRVALTGSEDGTARLWDANSGRPIGRPLTHPNVVNAVAFSPDGRTVLTGCDDGTARLWDATTGRPIGRPWMHQGEVNAVAFSPDGRTALTGSYDKTARLWDAATGRPMGRALSHGDRVLAVAVSPDGKSLLTGSHDKTARLWDAATGRPIGSPWMHQGAVNAVAFSPDGKMALTGGDDTMARLWDTATGRPIGRAMSHQGPIGAAAFGPDGRMILTGSDDATARLWDAAPVPFGLPMDHPGRVRTAAFSPDGRRVVTGSEGRAARIWDVATGRPLGRPLTHQGAVPSVALSPDGERALTGSDDRTARLWDANTGQPIGPPLPHDRSVTAVALGPGGRVALAGCSDGDARLWDPIVGRPVGRLTWHGARIVAAAFSPDGTRVLTGSRDMTARAWDAATGRPLGPAVILEKAIESVIFSPDGRTALIAGHDNAARLWEAATWSLGVSFEHQGRVSAAAFSPDGTKVLTGSWDRTARLWDADSGRPVGHPFLHQDHVDAVAFSPDARTILTGSDDATARLWDAATGRPLGPPLAHPGRVHLVAFGPDGQHFLTASEDATARLWDAPSPPDALPDPPACVEVVTGLRLDGQGQVRRLDGPAWRASRERLARLGGPPPDPARRLDPIRFAPDPAAEGDALAAIGLTPRAEEAYAEVIRARPLSSSARIARARLHAARSRLEEAATDFARAFALGDRRPEWLPELLANDAIFDRAMARLSTDDAVALWLERGRYDVARREWDRAEATFARALAAGPGEARLWFARGEARILRGAWREAAADFARGLVIDPSDHWTWYRLAPLWTYLGDPEAYRRHRRRMLERFAATDDPIDAERTAKACLLLPPDPWELERACDLAGRGTMNGNNVCYADLARGLAEYRRGRWREAIRWLDRSFARDGTPWGHRVPAHLVLSMAHLRSGQFEAAQAARAKAAEIERNEMPRIGRDELGEFWFEVFICAVLRHEAEALFLDRDFPPDPFSR